MPSWFFGSLQTVSIGFLAPAEVALVDIEQLRTAESDGDAALALAAVAAVADDTERFADGDAGATVSVVSLDTVARGRELDVVGTFRVTDDRGTVLDEATLTAPTVEALGTAYGQRIAPHEVTEVRTLYTTGSPGLRDAMARVTDGDWDGAIALWREEVRTGSPKNVARARHDLAVSAERVGRLDRALQLARNAAPVLPSASDRYVLALEARWRDDRLLVQQLPDRDGTADRPDGQPRGDAVGPEW